jgi:hypothetical protein
MFLLNLSTTIPCLKIFGVVELLVSNFAIWSIENLFGFLNRAEPTWIVWPSSFYRVTAQNGPRPPSTRFSATSCRRSDRTTRWALGRALPPDCHRVAYWRPPFHASMCAATLLGLILLQAGKRNTARHSLLSRVPLLIAPPRSAARSAAHRRCSGPAVRSPPHVVPWPHVELSVQSCYREEPHRGVLRCDAVLVSALGASMMTAFFDGYLVQPNRPWALPHRRSTRRPVNRRRWPVDWSLTGGSPSPNSRHHREASLLSPVLPAAPKCVTPLPWSSICSPPPTSPPVTTGNGRRRCRPCARPPLFFVDGPPAQGQLAHWLEQGQAIDPFWPKRTVGFAIFF